MPQFHPIEGFTCTLTVMLHAHFVLLHVLPAFDYSAESILNFSKQSNHVEINLNGDVSSLFAAIKIFKVIYYNIIRSKMFILITTNANTVKTHPSQAKLSLPNQLTANQQRNCFSINYIVVCLIIFNCNCPNLERF